MSIGEGNSSLITDSNQLPKNYFLMQTTEKIPKWEAHGMVSADGEYVKFLESIILTGPSEKWLKSIEIAMRAVLKNQLRDTLVMLRKMSANRDRWLEKFPGQLCLTTCQMQWTTNCTRSLLICNYLKNRKPLKKLRRKQNKILGFLSELSRRDLPKQLRLKVNAVITIEIHSRDVIDKMYRMSKSSEIYSTVTHMLTFLPQFFILKRLSRCIRF